MKQRKIAVIAGTSDATDWIRSLPETDSVTAFVATPYGKKFIQNELHRTRWAGWMLLALRRHSPDLMKW